MFIIANQRTFCLSEIYLDAMQFKLKENSKLQLVNTAQTIQFASSNELSSLNENFCLPTKQNWSIFDETLSRENIDEGHYRVRTRKCQSYLTIFYTQKANRTVVGKQC